VTAARLVRTWGKKYVLVQSSTRWYSTIACGVPTCTGTYRVSTTSTVHDSRATGRCSESRSPDGELEAASDDDRGYIGMEKSLYYAFQLISCQPRLGTRPGGLGEIQAVTVLR
jgi:hypothetical protein